MLGVFDSHPGPLLVRGGEGERFIGRLTQGSADFVSLALGYLLPGFQPLKAGAVERGGD